MPANYFIFRSLGRVSTWLTRRGGQEEVAAATPLLLPQSRVAVSGTSDTGGPTFKNLALSADKPNVRRVPPSSVTSPALMLPVRDPKLMQLRLVNYYQFSYRLYFNLSSQ